MQVTASPVHLQALLLSSESQELELVVDDHTEGSIVDASESSHLWKSHLKVLCANSISRSAMWPMLRDGLQDTSV
jgi:hypothetical protein